MRVTINQYGQVLKIEDSFLVANASFIKQEYIDFVIKGLTDEQRDKLELGFLSVVRQDGFPVNDLIMARSIDLETGDLTFSHKVSDSSQIFACAGNIQISLQAKGLRDDIELLDPSGMGDMDYYQTFASCTVVGHVQKNIGTEEEYDLVSTKINDAVANLQSSIANSQDLSSKAYKLAVTKTSGKAYASYKDMVDDLNEMNNEKLFVGLPIFIAEANINVYVYKVETSYERYAFTSDKNFLALLTGGGVQVGWYVLFPQNEATDFSKVYDLIKPIPESFINDLFK